MNDILLNMKSKLDKNNLDELNESIKSLNKKITYNKSGIKTFKDIDIEKIINDINSKNDKIYNTKEADIVNMLNDL